MEAANRVDTPAFSLGKKPRLELSHGLDSPAFGSPRGGGAQPEPCLFPGAAPPARLGSGGFSPSKATRATKAPRRRKLSSSRHRLRRRRPQPIDAVLAPPRSTPSSLPAAAAILEPRRRRRCHRHLAAASTAFLTSSPLPLPRYATAAVPLAVNT